MMRPGELDLDFLHSLAQFLVADAVLVHLLKDSVVAAARLPLLAGVFLQTTAAPILHTDGCRVYSCGKTPF
ncbi:MAG: hypothetical protein GX125_06875 [Bacteroidales bacterium]|jgi:hypothetical protein|nr:hypothetical protein [Bacteroidales bacterium]